MKLKLKYSLVILISLLIATCEKDDPSDPLSNSTGFTSFEFTNEIIKDFTFTIDNTSFVIKNNDSLPYGFDVSALISQFSTASGSIAMVGSVIQTSGVSVNDFTNDVTYTVLAEDGIATKSYIVKVNVAILPVALTTGWADLSKYVAVGASFTAGFTDGALFKAGQGNSFPNILSKKFAMANENGFKGDFKQPLMNDNIGGLLLGGTPIQPPRLYFNGTAPVRLGETPTTEITSKLQTGPFNNMGVPGAKSFHLEAPGYGNVAGVGTGSANPYFVRMATSSSILEDVLAQNPTFFTLSEIGGNDVLSYALSGGTGVDQTGNIDPRTYGKDDITDPTVFAVAFTGIVEKLIAGGAKGVVANIPYITSLSYFTTVSHNPVPLDLAKVTELNGQLSVLIQILTALGQPDRIKLVTVGNSNRLLIKDETLTDLSAQIAGALAQAPTISVQQANFIGNLYGQVRHARDTDLITLPTSSIIGTEKVGIPEPYNVIGVTYPLEDANVLIPSELMAIKTAIDAYNATIKTTAMLKGLAFVDFKAVLEEASTTGVRFDDFNLRTQLVIGGLVGLDGIHLTARGYALMANKILEAIDAEYDSNFMEATNGLAKAEDYKTSYPKAIPE